MKIRSHRFEIVGVLALVLHSGPSYANVVGAADEAAAAPEDMNVLGDIIVTANKREQRLNDVGLAVAVIDGAALKNQQINSLADIANVTPSLSYANTSTGTPVYTLRGVGFYEQSLGSYPAVSLYVDEVPLAFPVLTATSAYDLERVEILKGPQGTLFGQNATGGAINFIAAKPLSHFSAAGNISYGRFNEVVADGYVTGPLASGLDARLAGHLERADGWQRSNSRPGDSNGKVRQYAGRLQLAFRPSPNLRFLANVNASQDDSDTQAPQTIAFNFQNPVPDPLVVASSLSPRTARAADWSPGFTFGRRTQYQGSLRTEVDVTDNITLTALTSYIDYKQRKANDGDGFAINSYDTLLDRGRIKSFTQEVRLGNDSRTSFRWVLGGNYEKSRVNQNVDLVFPNSSASETLGTLGYPISATSFYSYQRFENYAAFGNVEYDLGRLITLKGGLRYTKSKDDVHACHQDNTGRPNETGPFFYNILLGGALGAYRQGACFMINDQNRTIGGVAPGRPGEYVDSLSENNLSWRAGVDYKPSKNILLYGNVAKGYKAGSFPTSASSAFVSYLPVTQESVMSYEAGAKLSLIDRTLQLNAAAFYYDYKNKQLRSKVLLLPFGNLDVLQNIPKSTIKGFEIELQARPTPGLSVNAAFTYIDGKIDQFVGTNASGLVADFGGTDMPFSPKYQVALSADYEFPVSDTMRGFVGSTTNLRSTTISIVGGAQNPASASTQNEALFRIRGYVLVDLRAGIRSGDGRWSLSVFGKNVFNEYYWNNVVAVFDTVTRYTGPPATYGVSIGFKY